ncbi:hypothetical protein [Pararhizobium sp. LjRoot255]|uniref:hypothetical protein n=1 Tax=Pararhizobium sp. LjRoot255 TaxID=3342298 RepID=UPI003F4F6E54
MSEHPDHRRAFAGRKDHGRAEVTGGTINRNGTLVVPGRNGGIDTVLSQVVEWSPRPSVRARRSRNLSGGFVPSVVVVAVAAFVGWQVLYR